MKKTSFNQSSYVEYDPSLDDYAKNHPNPFPRQMEIAIAIVEKYGLPSQLEKPKKSKKPASSSLQNELLTIYNFEPTEEQMQQLKAFLAQLFADKINASKAHQEVEMMA